MNGKNSATTFRDEHGVAELLRKVKQRNNLLKEKGRKAVNDIKNRVEKNSEKAVEANSSSDNDDTSNESSSINGAVDIGSGSVNRWGKDFFQKFSTMQTMKNPLVAKADNRQQEMSKPDAKDFFRKLSIKGIQKPPQESSSDVTANEPSEIKKALERSSQASKEMFQNFSTNFQTFSKNLQSSLSSPQEPTNKEAAAAVSDSLRASSKIKFSHNVASPRT